MASSLRMIRKTDLKSIRSKLDAERFLRENVCPNQEYGIKISNYFVIYIITDVNNNVAIFSKRGDIFSSFVPICEETRDFDEVVDWVFMYRKYVNETLLKN